MEPKPDVGEVVIGCHGLGLGGLGEAEVEVVQVCV
jgi:hypothetical protein